MNIYKRLRIFGFLTLALFSISTFVNISGLQTFSLFAQESNNTLSQESSEPAELEVAPLDEENYLAEAGKLHIGNDPTVIVLIVLFLLAVAVMIDRAIFLFQNRGNNASLLHLITHKLSEMPDSVDKLLKKIEKGRYGLEGRIVLKTLSAWTYGKNTMQEFSDAAMIAEQRGAEKRLVVLSTLGNNTPFIGLLGTVLGIMKAFRDLATMGDAGPAVVMKGISEALIATAFGLGVAIPCVIAYNLLSKMIKTKFSNATEMISIVVGLREAKEQDSKKKK